MDTSWPSFKYHRKTFETIIWGSCSPFLQMNIFPCFWAAPTLPLLQLIWAPPTPPWNPTPKVQRIWRYFALTRLVTRSAAVTARLELSFHLIFWLLWCIDAFSMTNSKVKGNSPLQQVTDRSSFTKMTAMISNPKTFFKLCPVPICFFFMSLPVFWDSF